MGRKFAKISWPSFRGRICITAPKVTALLAALEDGEPRTPLGVRRLANAKRHWTLTTELRSDVSTDA